MSAADDFNKILFADAVLDLLAAKVVERLAATGGGQDKAAGIQVKVESGQDWVSAKVARAVLGRSDSWLHRTAQQHPEIKRSMKQPHQKVGRPLYSLRRIYRIWKIPKQPRTKTMNNNVKERPILFSADMIRALLQEYSMPGQYKNQTRRTRGLNRFNDFLRI